MEGRYIRVPSVAGRNGSDTRRCTRCPTPGQDLVQGTSSLHGLLGLHLPRSAGVRGATCDEPSSQGFAWDVKVTLTGFEDGRNERATSCPDYEWDRLQRRLPLRAELRGQLRLEVAVDADTCSPPARAPGLHRPPTSRWCGVRTEHGPRAGFRGLRDPLAARPAPPRQRVTDQGCTILQPRWRYRLAAAPRRFDDRVLGPSRRSRSECWSTSSSPKGTSHRSCSS